MFHAAYPDSEKALFQNSVPRRGRNVKCADVEDYSAAWPGKTETRIRTLEIYSGQNHSLQHASVDRVCILYENRLVASADLAAPPRLDHM